MMLIELSSVRKHIKGVNNKMKLWPHPTGCTDWEQLTKKTTRLTITDKTIDFIHRHGVVVSV